MNCHDAKNLIAVGVYGCLTPAQREELSEHVGACAACTRLYERSSPLLDLPAGNEDVPLPDPERSWKVIAERGVRRRRFLSPVPFRRWAPIMAALLMVFTLGYLAGRKFLGGGGSPVLPSRAPAAGSSFSAYADHLRPVLINFLNQDGVETPENIRRLEREMIRDMLARTRMLKNLSAREPEPALQDLLQDLEFILTAMDNLRPDDRETARHLAGLIRDKQVPLRLQELIKSETIL